MYLVGNVCLEKRIVGIMRLMILELLKNIKNLVNVILNEYKWIIILI